MMTEFAASGPARDLTRSVVEMAYHQIERIRRRIRLRRDRMQLRAMPDYALKDLGISRFEIDAVTEFGFTDTSRRRRG